MSGGLSITRSTPSPVITRTWKPLAIGAGGFVFSIDIASDGTKVIKTDTYGAYLFNSGSGLWQQIVTTASMPSADAALGAGQGVYEIAICPSNPSRFYMIFNGWVFISNNKGTTWTKLSSLAQDTSAAPNDNFRSFHRKIAVDPQNADFVFVSTPTTGVSYSKNAGSSWTTIGTGSIATASGGIGYLVAFDPSSTVTGGFTQGIYVSSYGNGVYHSINGGVAWAHLNTAGMPTTHQTMIVPSTGIVWLVDASNSGSLGGLNKYSGGTWTSYSGQGTNYVSVAVDPANTSHVYILGFSGYLNISLNNGTSWTGDTAYTTTSADIPWISWYITNNTTQANDMASSAIAFDPSVANTMYQCTGLGVFTTNPPTTNTSVTWTDKSRGIEQLVGNVVISPPGGNPLVAVWDQGIFESTSPTTFPSTHGPQTTPSFAACWSCDYASASPSTIVALTNWDGNEVSGKSTDGGNTWSTFVNTTHVPFQGDPGGNKGGMIAASSATNYVMVRTDNGGNPNQMYYTTDGGANWSVCGGLTGIPTSGTTGWNSAYFFNLQTLCADRVDANTFYVINDGQGTGNTGGGVWKSTNGGATWTKVSTSVLGGAISILGSMKAVPGQSGHLFRSSGKASGANFERSTNHGAGAWSSVTNVTEVWAFGFGKPPSGGYPSIYIAGFLSGVWGIYRSDDNALSWTLLTTGFPLNSFDIINSVTGDANTYGICYVAFQGSGFAIYS